MKKFLVVLIKIIISVLAIANMVWFLVFNYQNPKEIFKIKKTITEDTEVYINTSGLHLEVPSNSLKYNGVGKFDPLKGVYVVDDKGVLVDVDEITYTISSKIENNIREKLIEYEAKVGDEVFYAKRDLSLGVDYTGPSIFIEDSLPYCKEGEIRSYANILKESGLLEVLDGFGNNIINNIEVDLKRYDRGEELATITISVTNEYQDSTSVDYQIPMNESGVVLLLVNDKAVVNNGSTFRVKDYVDQCYYETKENSLLDNVFYDGSVDTSDAGRYHITVYTKNSEGTTSVGRELEVIVLEKETDEVS